MILTVPVLYPACVVRPGHRRTEYVLLAAETHVRIPSPPGFGPAIRVSQGFLEELRATDPGQGIAHMRLGGTGETYCSDSEEATALYVPLRFSRPSNGAIVSEPITGSVLERVGAMMLEAGRDYGMLRGGSSWPFQIDLEGATNNGVGFRSILREDTEFRSVDTDGDMRNIAIAHAARVAATLRVDRDGVVHVPSAGPCIDVDAIRGAQLMLRWQRREGTLRTQTGGFSHHRLDQADQAAAFVRLVSPECPSMPDFSAEVLRPAAYAWSATPGIVVQATAIALDIVVKAKESLLQADATGRSPMSQDSFGLLMRDRGLLNSALRRAARPEDQPDPLLRAVLRMRASEQGGSAPSGETPDTAALRVLQVLEGVFAAMPADTAGRGPMRGLPRARALIECALEAVRRDPAAVPEPLPPGPRRSPR